jgi:rare lipoprotein A
LIISKWRLGVRATIGLMSLSLAASCATQQHESPQASSPAPVVAGTPPAPSVAVIQPAPSMVAAPHPRTPGPRTARVSYQGEKYSGHRTANGERYDPDALTAASSTLPMGSSVLVTDPATGRSVKVRINDRSPKAHGRALDLSTHAAKELGITDKGVARVKIKRAEPTPDANESPDPRTASSSH